MLTRQTQDGNDGRRERREALIHFRRREWEEAVSAYRRLDALDPEDERHLAIALVNSGRFDEGTALLRDDLLRDRTGSETLQRLAIIPAIRANRLDDAIGLLRRIVAARPADADAVEQLGMLLMRAGRRAEGYAVLEQAGELAPEDATIAAHRIMGRLQRVETEEAAELARRHIEKCRDNPRLAQMCLLALDRAADFERAAGLVDSLGDKDLQPEVASAAAQALLRCGRPEDALRIARAALEKARVARLHFSAAQALIALGGPEQEIVDHLTAAQEVSPKDPAVLKVLGETLLQIGRSKEAAAFLERAVALTPKLFMTRMLHARALKYAGQYDAAAKVMMEAGELAPNGRVWKRQATNALLQAGQEEEANELFREYLDERRSRLGRSFEADFAALDDRLDEADIPRARFDWAWKIQAAGQAKIQAAGRAMPDDRAQWEREARWGNLADLLVLDWLECRAERLSELAQFVGDISAGRELIRSALAGGKGAILVSAHIGSMYAGPLALHLAGLPHRWLASTPRIATTAYVDALISTSGQGETQVARQVIETLKGGSAVTIAVDGAMSPSAPRVQWEGQSVTYSHFAGAMVYRLGVQSLFVVPYWEKGRLSFVADPMPHPEKGEAQADFLERWREAYFDQVRAVFARGPRNLRMAGGIWRHVR